MIFAVTLLWEKGVPVFFLIIWITPFLNDFSFYGAMIRNHPSKFPKADVILPLIKSVCITPTNFDNMDCPICVESYEFRPAQVLATITVEEYLLFVMYCLEYRSMVIEQLSE